jgi:serine/threonine-protein kinase
MDKYLEKDEQRFLKALSEAAGPFLQAGADANKDIKGFPEPIGTLARYYQKDLELDDVASELGIEDTKEFQNLIRSNPKLRQLGLGPLLQGASIKRSHWQSLEKQLSPFQQSAFEIQIGTPHRSL